MYVLHQGNDEYRANDVDTDYASKNRRPELKPFPVDPRAYLLTPVEL